MKQAFEGPPLRRWAILALGTALVLLLTSWPAEAQPRSAPSRPQAVSRPSTPASPPSVRSAVPRSPGGGAPQGPRRNPPSTQSPGHRGSDHGYHSSGHGFGGHRRHGGRYLGFGYYPWYFGYPYYYPFYFPYSYPYPLRWYSYRAGSDMGAIDLNVRPQKAAVYVNGQRIGKVDQFNGYPGYLWLQEGSYDLVFYKEGFETVHREVTIYSGVVIDFRLELSPGNAIPAEEVLAAAVAKRPMPSTATDDSEIAEAEPRPAPYATRRFRPRQPRERPGAPGVEVGRIVLSVDPEDASIYLDGRFLGLASELMSDGSGLMVNPGEHRLSVVRPGYEAQELDFKVDAGERLELAVTLSTASES